ncbi:RNA-directed DNA polymerase [Fictibacillus sp. 26RED30]|uniref:RNA-directed DNA polymerase n=1 Tax=Fictibacillus sp. 26RED30 TaxID=2745877 RepID=UPI0018CDACC5|nr:RNA-directed DNA polymerase [Fictibacillus sp. 26RED30]MBH0163199.1 RNA-directed DNA polymerase [Fictibacillus sp. 26RED30]
MDKLFPKIETTQPFNFLIYKNESSTRLLSLIHPLAQLNIFKVVEKYDLEIINFFKQNAIFSLRYPYKVNNKFVNINDTISKNLLSLLNEDSDDSSWYPSSYFIKKRFTRINHFYNSNFIRKLEIKYSKLMKIDFQNCFYNIYTHSLDWSYLGDIQLAKENRSNLRVSTILDKVLQAANFGETNGIVVGPEFSRYIAEFVLCNIDKIVYEKLKQKRLLNKIDYEVLRFMDDIFIFCNESIHASEIKKVIEEACFRYRLSINETKSQLEYRPFFKNNLWESKIRIKLVNFNKILSEYNGENHRVINNIFQEITDEVKELLIDFPGEQHKLIGYVLKFFENKIEEIVVYINEKNNTIRKYILFKLIDLIQYLLIFSINFSNILKFIKLSLFLYLSEKDNGEDATDLLYKKSLEILKYHSNKRTEVLNLFVFLRFIAKDIPEGLLIRFINESNDYFTVSTIAYYISAPERKYRYKNVKRLINLTIDEVVQNFLDGEINKYNIKKILVSKDFYLIYDFYTSPILFKETKAKIDILKRKVDIINIDWSEKNLYNFFIDFIKGFNSPFMNWDANIKDIIEVLDRKSLKLETSNSG